MTTLTKTALPLLAALTLALGCSQGPTDQVPDPAGESQQQLEEPAPGAPRARGAELRDGKPDLRAAHGGPAMLLGAALRELDLSDDQKQTIEGLLEQLGPEHRAVDSSAHRELDKALAAAVRSGKVDDGAFATQLDAIEKAATERETKLRGALDSLHATLDASQRAALVAKLEQPMKEGPMGWGKGPHAGPRNAPMGAPPDPASDDGAIDDEPRAAPFRRVPGHHGGRGMRGGPAEMHAGFMRGGLERQLELTEQQRTELRAALQKEARPDFVEGMAEMKNRAGALLGAFAKDDFQAAKVMSGASPASRVRQAAEMRIRHVRSVLGVLSPEQQTKYAALLEQGDSCGFRGPKGR